MMVKVTTMMMVTMLTMTVIDDDDDDDDASVLGDLQMIILLIALYHIVHRIEKLMLIIKHYNMLRRLATSTSTLC